MKKIDLGVIVTTLIIVTISCSLAFFAARVVGEPKDINLVAKNVAVTFNDTSIIANGVVSPGWNTTKTFTITNNSKEEYKYNISIKDLINTFVTEGYLQYKITSTNGYNMTEFKDIPKSSVATDTILAYSVSIPVGVTQSYTIEFKYANDESVDQSEDMGKVLKGTLFITEGNNQTLAEKLLEDNPTISERTDFSTPFTTNTTNTLYKAKEDNTDVYYFAGIDGTPAHCEYQGNIISNYDDNNPITEKICTSNFTACKRGRNITYGDSSCEMHDGSDYTVTGAQWITSENKPINNWVKFGKNSSGTDLYWRIIRTNSDGSVKLLYHSTSTTTKNAYIGTSEFNTTNNDPMYVGYMYGTSGSLVNNRTNANNSTIKGVIDTWYKDNLNTNYGKYISTTAVYCNDRSNPAGGYNTENSNFYYGAYTRLVANKTPSYDCATTEDKFTVDTSTGNGKLTYPIALMTADEVVFAGGVDGTNAPTWYYTNSSLESSTGSTVWWLLSPNDGSAFSCGFSVYGSSYPGLLNEATIGSTHGVRPAISLKSCVKTSGGDGSANAPYTIKETTSGC